MSRLNIMSCMVASTLAGALSQAWAAPQLQAHGTDMREQLWTTVADSQLDRMRGGFNFGGGLMISIGLERLVNINGQMVTQTTVPMVQLNQLNPEQLSLIGAFISSLTVIQNGPGNSVETAGGVVMASAAPPAAVQPTPPVIAPPTPPDVTAPVAPVVVPPTGPGVTAPVPPVVAQPTPPDVTAPTAPVVVPPTAPDVTTPVPPVVAQPTPPDVTAPVPPVVAQPTPPDVTAPTPPVVAQPTPPTVTQVQGSGPGLVIQNSLNDQIIQQLTTINISTNALAMFKDGSWQQQLNDSIRASMGTLGR